jgi:maltose O-acetyltransferase
MSDRTEKEKMLAGELYLSNDPALQIELRRARRITRLYNQTNEEEPERRWQLLQELFAAVGPGADIQPPFFCDFGTNITAGAKLFMNFNCVILDCNRVTIGDNVMFGPAVHIYAATHPTDPSIRLTGRELGKPVRIGSNVWVGGGAIIGPGVSIGDNTTIGAGSVVMRDVPSNVVAVGNPCRVIKRL